MIEGTDSKPESRRTSLALRLAASEPSPMAILTSASFIARMSLTPSPVMATVLPCFLRASMRCFFSVGLTRVKMVYSLTSLDLFEYTLIMNTKKGVTASRNHANEIKKTITPAVRQFFLSIWFVKKISQQIDNQPITTLPLS